MNTLSFPTIVGETQYHIPETFRKGELFESYVRNYLFPKGKYHLIDKTHSYLENKGDFIEKTNEPDFTFKTPSGKVFYVETKYRSRYFDGAIRWCKFYQLLRYRDIDQHTPIYIVIGTGPQPNDPTQLFFIPLKDIKYVKLFPSFLRQYTVPIKKCICEDKLN